MTDLGFGKATKSLGLEKVAVTFGCKSVTMILR